MGEFVNVMWDTTDDLELTIAYSGSTVVVGYQHPDRILLIKMTPAQAIHLMMELREALNDLNTDPGEED